jgi:choline kinase
LPKVLLEIGREPLLARNVRQIREAYPDIERIAVVVGFREDEVRAAGGATLDYVVNRDYAESNTAHSLALALERCRDETLLMNGDVLCDVAAIEQSRRLVSGAVCEFKDAVDAEEVQVQVDTEGAVTRIGKDIGGVAEAVGIYRLSQDWASRYLDTYTADFKTRYYEDVFDRMLQQTDAARFGAVDLTPGFAIEIDTPSDLGRATAFLQSTAKAA